VTQRLRLAQARAPRRLETAPEFAAVLASQGLGPLRRGRVTTLQVNVGRRCDLACHHCHVEAGPARTEALDRGTAERIVAVLARDPAIETLDLTGGAPELNPQFRFLVTEARRLGRRVIDRCNLTILERPGQEDTAAFLAEHGAEVIASLPCYTRDTVEQQRGRGVFDMSIAALRRLNALGYGMPGSTLALHLVYNPLGGVLPPPQQALEARYHAELRELFGIHFHRLFVLTNMPIRRFARSLARKGEYAAYLALLAAHFNPATVPGLMCRNLVSVDWQGRLYDCDFHQAAGIEFGASPRTLRDLDTSAALEGAPIATAPHCFGCTAGSGSSCGGALADLGDQG
jgi:radical SAM/Cys-rich protein